VDPEPTLSVPKDQTAYGVCDIITHVTEGYFSGVDGTPIQVNTSMKNDILIAYYSWSGNTRKIAGLIEHETGGRLFEVEPVQPYTTDYRTLVAQAKEEIEAGFRPELKALPKITSYTVVFLGTPIWWHTMAPPLAAFIDRLDLDNKTVAPFHTHGGGGGGSFEADVAKMCPDSTVTKGFGAYNGGGSEAEAEIGSWLSSIGMQRCS
jgi:flavodoxin